MLSERALAFRFFVVFIVSIAFGLGHLETTLAQNVESKVLSDLGEQGKATFFVVMKQQANTGSALAIADWKQRGEVVTGTLKELADRTQRPILERLAEAEAEVIPFWIVNTIRVTTSDSGLINELAVRPEVAYLKADQQWRLPEPLPGVDEPTVQAVEWGVARVRAPDVWQQFGVYGEDIVVANIDTGVQFNHPAVVMQYRGRQSVGTFDHNYNWHDPSRICPSGTPCDNNGHGTHTMGTMVGDDGGPNQIGVAPRARWIAAKGCEAGSCSTTALLSSGQWVLAPTDLNGQNPRPDLRPHVVNNSWGGGTSDPFFRTTVQNWLNAGIFPAFANGNSGPACGSARIPGAYPESFGVGATDIADSIASFSSRGPATAFGGIAKPNVSAPGVNVRSAWNNGDYRSISGTSMATPHVTGVVALLWSASPALVGDIAGTFDLLQDFARPRESTQCGAPGPPNNVYGWGIIDAMAAVEQAIAGGMLEGRVTDASGEVPIANAAVRAEGPITRTVSTNSDGAYRMRLTAGTYTVTASRFGYLSATATGVQISEGQTTTQNFSLDLAPGYWVWGVVSSFDGQPVADAEVGILGIPLAPVRTDAYGFYLFPVPIPEGTYDVRANSGRRCLLSRTERVAIDRDIEVNFALDPKADGFGYLCIDTEPSYWIPGVDRLPLSGDDFSTAVTPPFPITFYGQVYNTIFVSTNGFVNFLSNRTDYNNTPLPNSALPNAGIYALWDDLLVLGGAGVFTTTVGEAPDRWFIIEWRNVTFYGRPTSSVATFEIALHESGAFVLQYDRTDGDGNGASATIGTENQNGSIGLQYSFNEPSAAALGRATYYFPPLPVPSVSNR